MAKKKSEGTMNYSRIGEQIDVLLTEIYGEYVAKGSPTKLGGLRFLDVPSAKTFALEKTGALDDGNVLTISAPFVGEQEVIESKMKEGPHSKEICEFIVRASSDAGKSNKFFVEIGYKLPTEKWLTEDAITKVSEDEGCNGNEAIKVILRQQVLPIAKEVMEHFIAVIREFSQDSAIIV